MNYAFYGMNHILSQDAEIKAQNRNLEEFSEMCRPLIEYLQKKCHPHTKIIIEWDRATLVEDTLGVPFRIPD